MRKLTILLASILIVISGCSNHIEFVPSYTYNHMYNNSIDCYNLDTSYKYHMETIDKYFKVVYTKYGPVTFVGSREMEEYVLYAESYCMPLIVRVPNPNNYSNAIINYTGETNVFEFILKDSNGVWNRYLFDENKQEVVDMPINKLEESEKLKHYFITMTTLYKQENHYLNREYFDSIDDDFDPEYHKYTSILTPLFYNEVDETVYGFDLFNSTFNDAGYTKIATNEYEYIISDNLKINVKPRYFTMHIENYGDFNNYQLQISNSGYKFTNIEDNNYYTYYIYDPEITPSDIEKELIEIYMGELQRIFVK